MYKILRPDRSLSCFEILKIYADLSSLEKVCGRYRETWAVWNLDGEQGSRRRVEDDFWKCMSEMNRLYRYRKAWPPVNPITTAPLCPLVWKEDIDGRHTPRSDTPPHHDRHGAYHHTTAPTPPKRTTTTHHSRTNDRQTATTYFSTFVPHLY